MKKGVLILLVALLALAGGFWLRLRGQTEPTVVPEVIPEWIEELNPDNALSSLPEMDAAVDSFMNFWSLHGLSLAVMRNDSLLYARGYGKADASTPMTPGTTLRLASVSKLLTAIGIMRLQEEGRLNLETPVFGPFGILKEYDSCIRDDNYYLITVGQLLRHQGGFSQRGGDVMFSTLKFMRNHGLSAPPSSDFLVRKELGRRLAFEPGTSHEYSNFGYLLLSLIIEKASGMSYNDYMQTRVFAPARCHNFRLGGDYLKDRLPGESRYYTQADDPKVPSFDGKYAQVDRPYGGNYISGLYGAGGWTGSTVELARLVASIDGRGPVPDLLEPFSVRQMTVYYDDDTYALGWLDCRPDGEWTRTGSFAGTSALIKTFPDGQCWVLVTNTSTWRGSRFSRNTSALVRNLRSRFSAQLPSRDLFRSN
ncbi:MAG: beta-lactamase family protein [Bacteroidales bacterium]|nr:beta-lactamase family protein [Bacteroidales bacterium]